MKKILVLVAGAALAVGACAPLQSGVGTASAAVDQSVLRGTQALLLAHDAYDAAEALIAPLVRARVFTAAQVNTIEDINNRAAIIFNTADGGVSDAEKAKQIMDLVATLQSLVPAKK